MSQVMPLLSTGVSGAEEEARSTIATVIAQVITIVRQIIAYVMEYMRKFLEWSGEHPLASTLLLANMVIWMS